MRVLRLSLVALVAGLLLMFACKDEPRYVAGAAGPSADRQRLCEGGGASFDGATNECVCAAGQKWNGIRCDATPAVAATPSLPMGIAPTGIDPHTDDEEDEAPADSANAEAASDTAKAPADAATPPAVDVAERLAVACKRARGTWLAKDSYCHCPKDQVLVGRRCRTLKGNVTDDACLRSVSKGRWKGGDCRCEDGLVFSPSRGGCVPKFTGDVAVLRRVCESSLNLGKWDAQGSRCLCPAGRVWDDELCQVQQRLSSRAVCESDFNRGQWQADAKRCTCPAGFVWHNQACLSRGNVSDEMACNGETSRGRWDKGLNRCLCPGLTRWDSLTKSCQ